MSPSDLSDQIKLDILRKVCPEVCEPLVKLDQIDQYMTPQKQSSEKVKLQKRQRLNSLDSYLHSEPEQSKPQSLATKNNFLLSFALGMMCFSSGQPSN